MNKKKREEIEKMLNMRFGRVKKEEREQLLSALLQIKPLRKMAKGKIENITIEMVEKCYQNISQRYHYKNQGINSFYEDGIFAFYSTQVLYKTTWIGTVYGETLFELMCKLMLKIYYDITKED